MAAAGNRREVLLGGGLMLLLGGGFLTVDFALTGQVPSGAPGVLFWAMVAFGAVRSIVGLSSRRRQPGMIAAAAEAWAAPEPPAAPEIALNAIEYDYWVLGLTSDASFRQVRRAFRELRGYWLSQPASPRTTFELAEVQTSYRRLRHMLGADRPVEVPELAHLPTT
jgi:hypothetical protein